MAPIKVIVMGVGGVGKSAITNRFIVGRWIEKYDPTIEESYETTVDIDGKALHVEILDTAGQDAYTPLRETFMHTGDGFLLVYSITDDQTLEELRNIREQILRVHRNKKVPIVVIGNKCDCESERAIFADEGKALAEEFQASFLEVSAKRQYKIKESFEVLIRKILMLNPAAGSEGGCGNVFGAGKVDLSVGDVSPPKMNNKAKSQLMSMGKQSSVRGSTFARNSIAGNSNSTNSSSNDKDDKKKKKGSCIIL